MSRSPVDRVFFERPVRCHKAARALFRVVSCFSMSERIAVMGALPSVRTACCTKGRRPLICLFGRQAIGGLFRWWYNESN